MRKINSKKEEQQIIENKDLFNQILASERNIERNIIREITLFSQ